MSAERDPEVSFQNVSKMFGDRQVLNDVSFEIPPGQTLCLMGRSGIGKSVTLRMLIGLLKPDKGNICIQSQTIQDLDEDGLSKVRRRMGFLFQSGALFSTFSLRDNLTLPLARFTKKSKAEIRDLVQKQLDEVGLGNEGNKLPSELSGGMRKRAGLARALVLEPAILLVDEPTSGLDRVTASEIDELLVKIKQGGKTTMVIVTHDIQGARRVGDRLAILDGGRIIAMGKISELQEHENGLVRALTSEENRHAS